MGDNESAPSLLLVVWHTAPAEHTHTRDVERGTPTDCGQDRAVRNEGGGGEPASMGGEGGTGCEDL